MLLKHKILMGFFIGLNAPLAFAEKICSSNEDPSLASQLLDPANCPALQNPFVCCENLCCSDFCATDCTFDCFKNCRPILCFETGLSVEANIIPGGLRRPNQVISLRCAPKNICGKLQLCFDPLMTKICYRITICGTTLTDNPNTRVAFAALFISDSCSSTFTDENVINVPLIPLTNDPCSRNEEPLCVTGEITMKDLECASLLFNTSVQTRSISCIYSKAIDGNLSVQVVGNADCVTTEPPAVALLRGTLRPCFVCPCHSR